MYVDWNLRAVLCVAEERRWVRMGETPQRKAVRKTHKLIQQQFKSISKQRWEKFLHQWAQEEEQVHRSREGRNNKSQRDREGGKKPLDSDLQIKKQSNQSCQRALIPGCSYQAAAEWNRTRLEYANLFVLSGWLGRGGGGGGKDKWAFQGMTQRPVKSLLSQTLINHCNRSY